MDKREQLFIDSPMDEKRTILKQMFSAYDYLMKENLEKATRDIESAESLWGSWLGDCDDLNRLKSEVENKNIGIAKNIAKRMINNLIDNMAPGRKRDD